MKSKIRNIMVKLMTIIAIGYWGTPSMWGQSAQDIMITPDEYEWKEMPILPKGVEMAMIEGSSKEIFTEEVSFTFRLKLPANFEIPAHYHPWIEHATVIRGTLNMCYDDKVDRSKTRRLPAGSVAVMQPDIKHFS